MCPERGQVIARPGWCEECHAAHDNEHSVQNALIASLSRVGDRVILWCKVTSAVAALCTAIIVVYGTITAAYAGTTLRGIAADEIRKYDADTAKRYDKYIDRAAEAGVRKAAQTITIPQETIRP
jgi:hypothetical protein